MIYIVVPGDNVDDIARQFGIPAATLIYDNQIIPPYRLAIGQALYIASGSDTELMAIKVNGYAYPFISPWVLRETLPFLTELSVFSYGFTADGALIYPLLDDMWMIQEARTYLVRPILTLTPLNEAGMFSNILISTIVNDSAAQENLIQNLIQILQEKGYQGVDIDFEYILPEDRDRFTEFVQNVTTQLNAFGYQVSVALAPKTSDTQTGLLYEGKDYAALGTAANHVLLMTYEWGYTYSPPMAVAPINKVREVVTYAITRIEPQKIDLGIPNYGYDWPLPYERGVTKAQTIGNVEAVQIAISYGVPIQFNEVAQSPFFNYTDENGISHEVWFEDVRSLQAKFNLIKEFRLRGCGYWQLMRWFRANWLLLSDNFTTQKAKRTA
ncbi:MAG: glycosyl hydrolase family 18 protein [Hespellia sp.]|nr:glycosyl hydrolase family 18 protein [Hespellia sp.]